MSRYLEKVGKDMISLESQVHGEIRQVEISEWDRFPQFRRTTSGNDRFAHWTTY